MLSYKNFFDEHGRITKSESLDYIKSKSSLENIEIFNTDQNGNITEYAVLNQNGTLKYYIKRVFEYIK